MAQIELTPGAELIQLEAKNEKNGNGSAIPLRSDLAEELRNWITSKALAPSALLFSVPAGLRRILDRDLKAAGIPKRDDRDRTIDVHALRTTFATMLSTSGTAPRTAQAAMRHSDIKLTMGTYTDAKHLDVREAMERLPNLHSATPDDSRFALHVAPHSCNVGQIGASPDKQATEVEKGRGAGRTKRNPRNANEKTPVTTAVITGADGGKVGLAGFEPTTSCTPSKRASQAALQPEFRHALSTRPVPF